MLQDERGAIASLKTLAERNAPDKTEHVLDIYEPFLEPLRMRPIVLLEIGVKTGGSLRMWRDYFPEGRIFGVDVKEGCVSFRGERIGVFIGDQSDTAFLDAVISKTGPLDIVLDDGSHQPGDQQASLVHVWPHLKPRGLYIVEDVHTSYQELGRFSGGWRKPGTTMEFLKDVLDDTHFPFHERPPILADLKAVHVFYRTALLRKLPSRSPEAAELRYKETYLKRRREAR